MQKDLKIQYDMHLSMQPGVVITGEPLTENIPLYMDNKEKVVSTQYQMKEVEELGILKMDFLGS